jgi:hypothetical protein
MIGVLGGVSALIGLFYVFVAFFGEYPNNTASPPLPVDINDQGVTDSSGTFYPFGKDSSGLDHNGVAGPFNYRGPQRGSWRLRGEDRRRWPDRREQPPGSRANLYALGLPGELGSI